MISPDVHVLMFLQTAVIHQLRDTYLPVTQQQHMEKVHLWYVLQDLKEQLVLLQLHVRPPAAGQLFQGVL